MLFMATPSLSQISPFTIDNHRISVLLVDDDPSMVEMSAVFLERELDTVDTTALTNPKNVLEELDDENYDCIVSDFDMPELDGLNLLTNLRENGIELPFVLFTGKGSEEIASQAISAGVDEYLQKGGPEEYPVLANKIENLVKKHWAETQVQRGFLAIESAEEGIGIIDEDGIYQYMNEAYAALYNRDRSELIGEHWGMLYPPEEADRFHDEILPELETSGSWRGVSTGVTKQGEPVPERLVLTQMESGGHVCIVQELEQNDEIESQLEWLGEFGHVLSHDLKTPLSVIQGNLKLAKELDDTERLDDAIDATARLESLIDDLANVMQKGNLVTDVESVEIDDVFRSWDTFETLPESLDILDSKPIMADKQALIRLAENLIKNTVEHAGDEAVIRVGTLSDGFYYEDDGPGIPEHQHENVFNPGFTTKEDGTGFGMVSIKQIVMAHGWTITIKESEAGGARFEFTDVTTPQ